MKIDLNFIDKEFTTEDVFYFLFCSFMYYFYFRDDDKFGRRDRFNGPTSDFKEKEGFKPNVKLEYIDDDGHVLRAKEAFRYLSHKFHGKGPGKNKVYIRLY